MNYQWLLSQLSILQEPHHQSFTAVNSRASDVLRPTGALAKLDEIAAWVGSWHKSFLPVINNPATVIFAGDHGIALSGVSNYPVDVTAAMVAAFEAQKSTVTAFAEVVGSTVSVIDVGVGRPTADIRFQPALDDLAFDQAIRAGQHAVDKTDCDLLVIGEMGIGNTTAAAAVSLLLCGGDVEEWVGRGTGIDDEKLAFKREAVRQAVARVDKALINIEPLRAVQQVGGHELAAMVGAMVAARQRRIPVVLDGFVVTASAMALFAANNDALAHCWAGHLSPEQGHRRLLERINKVPLLDLGMRLGEGSGALAAVPIIKMACAGITQVPTFAEWFK